MTPDPETARLFFAAWPEPGVQDALHGIALQARRECGGRAIAARNIHLTLAFLGNVGRARVAELESLAQATGGAPCDLVVDRIGFFRESRIVWAGVERCPDALRALAGALASGLRALEFRLDRRPFVPHVTLLRNARRRPVGCATAPLAWPVRGFALVESVQRGGERIYEVLQRWPLRS